MRLGWIIPFIRLKQPRLSKTDNIRKHLLNKWGAFSFQKRKKVLDFYRKWEGIYVVGYLFNMGDVFLVEQLEYSNKKLKDVKDFACIAFLIMLQ